MKQKNTKEKYKDITSKWLKEKGKEKGYCLEQKYLINDDITYIVDNINVVQDHTTNELNIAKWFAKTKKVDIKMLPRISYPQKIKSADFIESKTGIAWEIKEPNGNTKNTTMLNQFKKQKEKANHFIIDIHLSSMPIKTAINEIEKILLSNRYDWIDTVILIKNLKLIKVYTRK